MSPIRLDVPPDGSGGTEWTTSPHASDGTEIDQTGRREPPRRLTEVM